MAIEVSTLSVRAQSVGIKETTQGLNNLTVSGTKAEQAVLKLSATVSKMSAEHVKGAAAANAYASALRLQQQAVGGSSANMQALLTAVGGLSATMASLNATIQSLNTNLNNNTRNVNQNRESTVRNTQAMRDAHAAARGLTGSLGALWLTYGSAVPLIAGAAIGASFKQIIKQGLEFENTIQGIGVRGQETAESIEKLRKTALDMGQGVYGPQQVAGALETLVLAGLKAEDAVRSVGAALNLALVGGTSIEKSAYTLVQVGTAMGYTADSFGVVGDVISKTAAASMSSVESLSEAFKSASSVGVVYGVTLKDLGTNLALLSNLGIQGSAAGTAVKNMYKELDSGAKRVKDTLAAVGVSVERDLKVDGKFKDLNSIVKILSDSLDKLGDQGGVAIQKITNERGMRSVAALLQAYRTQIGETGNAFESLNQQIENSAGYAAIGAARLANTSKNQVESTLNTLKKTFIDTFAEMQPQVNIFADKLKTAFSSQEFKSAIVTIATTLADLFVLIANNIPTIVKLAETFIALKVAMFAMDIASKIAVGFQAFAVATEALTGTTVTLRTAMIALQASILPISAVLLAAGAAYAFFKWQQHDALDTKVQDEAAASSKNFSENLRKEAERLDIANKSLQDGLSLKEATIKTNRELALSEERARGAKAVDDAQGQYNKALGKIGSIFSPHAAEDAIVALKNIDKVKAATKASYDETLKQLDAVESKSKLNEKLTEDRQAKELARNKARSDLAANLAGNPDIVGGGDVKATAETTNAIETQIAANKRWIAGHTERLELIKKVSDAEVMMAGNSSFAEELSMLQSEQGIKAIQGLSKAEAERLQKRLLQSALDKDQLKFEEDKAQALKDFTDKIQKSTAAEEAYNKVKDSGNERNLGAGEREAASVAKRLGYTQTETEALMRQGKVLDENNRLVQARNKLEEYAANLSQQAGNIEAEADAMALYGTKVKAAAIDLAEITLQKQKLAGVTGTAISNNVLEAASLKQLSESYRDVVKIGNDADKDLNDIQAQSLMVFADTEMAKLKIKQDSAKKLIQIDLDRANAALQTNADLNNGLPDVKALEIYEKIKRESVESLATLEQTASAKANLIQLEDWKKTVDNIEKVGRDGFDSLFESGSNRWSSLMDTFKKSFKTTIMDYIYKQFAKPFFLNVVAQVTGAMGLGGISNAAQAMSGVSGGSSLSSAVGLAKSAKDIYSAITNGFTGLASTVGTGLVSIGSTLGSTGLQAFGAGFGSAGTVAAGDAAGLYAAAGGVGSGSAVTAGAYAGSAATAAAGIGAGVMGGRLISGQYGSNGAVNTGAAVGAIVGSIVPVIGTALGGLVGGLLGGLYNRTFGMGKKKVTSEGIRGTLSADGSSGENYSNWTQKGGWFRSDKKGTETSALSADVLNTLTAGIQTLQNSASGLAKNIGVSSDSLKNYSTTFDIVMGKDAQENAKALEDYFIKLNDTIATRLIPNIADFALSGETASETMTRLSSVFQATNSIASMLGKTAEQAFGSVGLSSDAARERLINLAGGLSALGSKTSAYAATYLTEAEKLAPVQKAVAEAMKSLGLSGITTKEQFKSIVNGLDLTTVAGATLFNNLMDLAPSFATVADAADEAKKQLDEVNTRNLETATQNLQTAYDKQSGTLQTAIDKLKSFQSSIMSFVEGLKFGSLSTLTPLQKLAEAQKNYDETLSKARGGDSDAKDKLTSVAQQFLEASQVVNSSSDAYVQNALQVQADLSNLAAMAGADQTAAQMQLDALNQQVNGLINLNETALGIQDAINLVGQAMVKAGLVTQEQFDAQHSGQMLSSLYTPSVSSMQSGVQSTSNNSGSSEVASLKAEIASLKETVKQTSMMIASAVVQTGDRNASQVVEGTHAAADKQIYSNKSVVTIGNR